MAYYVTWGFDDVPNEEKTVIPTSTCTPEQLGVYPNGTLSGKQDLFYPVHPNSQNDLKFFHKKFQCFDSEMITPHGDYNSAKTRNLLIAFEMCDQAKRVRDGNPRRCKSDREILKWMRHKYIVLYYNSRRFRIEEYNEGKIVEESRTKYIPFNSQLREDIVFKVQLTDLQLQDERFSISAFTQDEKRVFNLNQVEKRPWSNDDRIHMAVTIEMDLDLQ